MFLLINSLGGLLLVFIYLFSSFPSSIASNNSPYLPHRVHSSSFDPLTITTRQQFLQKTGRIRWAANEVTESWIPEEIGMIVVDMWDQHWCPSATERVGALAILINTTINAARDAGVQIIHAPSECDAYYVKNPSRLWTLALPNVTMPVPSSRLIPTLPIDNSDGGCDVLGAVEKRVWTKETDYITIHPEDALIEDSDNAQTLWNLVVYRGLKHLVYIGVHENMCIMDRTFAIETTYDWGVDIAVTREATDTMYDPSRPPYCSHEVSVELMTEYIEKFWGKSLSVYDFINPRNRTEF